MTDRDIIEKKLAFLALCVHEARTLSRPALLDSDVRERRFVEHTLQLAIQAALDVCGHIIAEERLGEPESNRDLFRLLVGAGWIDARLGPKLERMAGFRNILVHGYTKVDTAVLRDVLYHHLEDLTGFKAQIMSRLAAADPPA